MRETYCKLDGCNKCVITWYIYGFVWIKLCEFMFSKVCFSNARGLESIINSRFLASARVYRVIVVSLLFRGVEGHFNGEFPWSRSDEVVEADCAKLVGE